MSHVFQQLGFFILAGAAAGVGLMFLFGAGYSVVYGPRQGDSEWSVAFVITTICGGVALAGGAFLASYGLSLQ